MTATPSRTGHPFAVIRAACALLLVAMAQGCAPTAGAGVEGAFDLRETTPAFLLSIDARDPTLGSDGRGAVALAWVTGDSAAADAWLSVSRDSGLTFSPPKRLNLAPGRVVSSPEARPAVAIGQGGALAVAWSEWRGDASRAVDLRVRASADFGLTLGAVTTLNDDVDGPPPGLRWRQRRDWGLTHRADATHGMPALAFTRDGSLFAAWLDDRRIADPATGRVATLWHAVSRDGGQHFSPNEALTDSASPRCRPALGVAPDGAVALVYRDASNDLRDPRLALGVDGNAFSIDTLIARDGWRLATCPGEAAALAWAGPGVGYAAWFTGATPPGVYVTRWRRDGGLAGLKRPVAEDLLGATHPVMTVLGESVLIGVETSTGDATSRRALSVRALDASGNWSAWNILGANASSGGLVAAGSQCALACWIEHEPGHTRLRLAQLTRRSGGRA